jgi:hypothetical protein
MTSPIHSTVVGVFDSVDKARAAVDDLTQHGFGEDCICVHTPASREEAGCGLHETHMDFPTEDAEWVRDELKAGRTVVIVRHADQQAEDVREVLRKHGGTITEPTVIGTYGTGLPATPF